MKAYGLLEISLHQFCTSVLDGGECSAPTVGETPTVSVESNVRLVAVVDGR